MNSKTITLTPIISSSCRRTIPGGKFAFMIYRMQIFHVIKQCRCGIGFELHSAEPRHLASFIVSIRRGTTYIVYKFLDALLFICSDNETITRLHIIKTREFLRHCSDIHSKWKLRDYDRNVVRDELINTSWNMLNFHLCMFQLRNSVCASIYCRLSWNNWIFR